LFDEKTRRLEILWHCPFNPNPHGYGI
jgi:hypothetical protein